MNAQKYKLDLKSNRIVFYASAISQIKRFLQKNGFLDWNQVDNFLELADPDELIDYNLVKLVQNKHVLADMIPFAANAEINLRCPFLAIIPSHAGDRRLKQVYLMNHYFCVFNFCKIKAAQLDPEFVILQNCCGNFVDQFNKELNKNL